MLWSFSKGVKLWSFPPSGAFLALVQTDDYVSMTQAPLCVSYMGSSLLWPEIVGGLFDGLLTSAAIASHRFVQMIWNSMVFPRSCCLALVFYLSSVLLLFSSNYFSNLQVLPRIIRSSGLLPLPMWFAPALNECKYGLLRVEQTPRSRNLLMNYAVLISFEEFLLLLWKMKTKYWASGLKFMNYPWFCQKLVRPKTCTFLVSIGVT